MCDKHIQESRIHCCLYFISPTGQGLRAIDLMVVKEIKCLNIVPAIAQSDRLTLEECEAFKVRIRDELSYHSIRLYPFDNEDQDTEELRPNEAIRVSNLLLQPQSSCPKE
ncbi:hypothetical protein MJO29_010054 [Puccinia striiformis f. sp. tritici]|nr:hypothetical protein MJO29_010054 [Puccinia striiformis f. sp. tritici]